MSSVYGVLQCFLPDLLIYISASRPSLALFAARVIIIRFNPPI
jgi:hypothetical protein